jgi:hypothetical protein
VSEVLDYPYNQTSYAHASCASVHLLILVGIEIVEVSGTRIKANAFLINMYLKTGFYALLKETVQK